MGAGPGGPDGSLSEIQSRNMWDGRAGYPKTLGIIFSFNLRFSYVRIPYGDGPKWGEGREKPPGNVCSLGQ